MILSGYPIAIIGIRSLLQYRININILITIAAVGAFMIGHLEEGAAVVFLYNIAEKLEDYAADRARHSIEALMELKEKFGSDMNQWTWGQVHLLTFRHPLSSAHPALEILNRGPFEVPGDNDTVNALWRYALDGYDCYGGVSYRQIIDVGDFSNSIAIFAPGQSGHPLSDHYADLIDLFLKGKYHPMLFHRTDVEKEKKHTLLLKPEKGE